MCKISQKTFSKILGAIVDITQCITNRLTSIGDEVTCAKSPVISHSHTKIQRAPKFWDVIFVYYDDVIMLNARIKKIPSIYNIVKFKSSNALFHKIVWF